MRKTTRSRSPRRKRIQPNPGALVTAVAETKRLSPQSPALIITQSPVFTFHSTKATAVHFVDPRTLPRRFVPPYQIGSPAVPIQTETPILGLDEYSFADIGAGKLHALLRLWGGDPSLIAPNGFAEKRTNVGAGIVLSPSGAERLVTADMRVTGLFQATVLPDDRNADDFAYQFATLRLTAVSDAGAENSELYFSRFHGPGRPFDPPLGAARVDGIARASLLVPATQAETVVRVAIELAVGISAPSNITAQVSFATPPTWVANNMVTVRVIEVSQSRSLLSFR